MAIKDILLPLIGEATPAAMAAIEKCVAMAVDIEARISAVAIETEVDGGEVVRPWVLVSEVALIDPPRTKRSCARIV